MTWAKWGSLSRSWIRGGRHDAVRSYPVAHHGFVGDMYTTLYTRSPAASKVRIGNQGPDTGRQLAPSDSPLFARRGRSMSVARMPVARASRHPERRPVLMQGAGRKFVGVFWPAFSRTEREADR